MVKSHGLLSLILLATHGSCAAIQDMVSECPRDEISSVNMNPSDRETTSSAAASTPAEQQSSEAPPMSTSYYTTITVTGSPEDATVKSTEWKTVYAPVGKANAKASSEVQPSTAVDSVSVTPSATTSPVTTSAASSLSPSATDDSDDEEDDCEEEDDDGNASDDKTGSDEMNKNKNVPADSAAPAPADSAAGTPAPADSAAPAPADSAAPAPADSAASAPADSAAPAPADSAAPAPADSAAPAPADSAAPAPADTSAPAPADSAAPAPADSAAPAPADSAAPAPADSSAPAPADSAAPAPADSAAPAPADSSAPATPAPAASGSSAAPAEPETSQPPAGSSAAAPETSQPPAGETAGSSAQPTMQGSKTQPGPLSTGGDPDKVPLNTPKPKFAKISSNANADSGNGYYEDGSIISPVDTEEPNKIFKREAHPLEMPKNVNDSDLPVQTNKFYGNLLLDDQKNPVYAMPYSVWWSNETEYPGMAVSHTNFDQKTYGPDAEADPVQYYVNPVGLMNVVFSAEEMSEDGGEFAVSDMGPFSVNTELSVGDGSIKLPIALGMGFVTAEYNGLTPKLTSQLGFKSLEKKDLSSEDKQKRDTPTYTNVTVANNSYATTDDSDSGSSANINKYVVELNNNPTKWVIYVSSPDGKPATLKKDKDGSSIVAEGKSDNVVFQVGVLPSGADAQMDKTAGTYPTKASLSANVTGGDVGVYSIDYETKGSSAANAPFIWALPHHVDSFTDEMADAETEVYLVSGTKGIMSGFASNRLIMSEQLHTDIQFLPVPVNSTDSKDVNYSDEVKDRIAKAAKEELSQNMTGQVDIAATYTAGKAFDKYAYIALVVNDILQNNESSKSALDQLKQAFSIWTKNEQPLPLLYDTRYKGIISSAAQDGDTGADFGNPYYNDHHFHYGYFIHAAAIIGHIDKQQGGNWIEENKDWVNNLVRDVANPSDEDTHFPVFRMFDFYHGHSWAHGMFASSGGKDEESTSEDINFAYGMKLWGNVIGDKKMEARGDLMIAIMKRSLDAYFYLKDDNGNQPKNFIKNKVAGITFENQVDHTTYFGTKLEYIQGIHMIPMTPVSAIVRTPEFVQQEWDQKIKGILDDVEDGWSGILRINQAIIDPKSSYEYFTSDDFDTQKQLDGGASLTWYLAYSAGMNGGSV